MHLDALKELTPVLYGGRTVIIYENQRFPPGRLCFVLHWHDRMELLLLHKGSIRVQVGEETVVAAAGDVVVIGPTRPHTAVALESGATYSVYMFDVAALRSENPKICETLDAIAAARKRFRPIVTDRAIARACRELSALRKRRQPGDELTETGLVYLLLGRLCAAHLAEDQPVETGRFSEVTDYIAAHYAEPLTTASLSARFGYVEAYFSRRFKALLGLPPMTYLRVVRLEAACERLRRGEEPLHRVALSCGFSDQNYFSRCFKRHYGMTPTEYAAAQRAADERDD